MLVLSRKIGEEIKIGNSVTVTILGYDRGVVRIGINAPKDIQVHRKEIYDKIVSLNKLSAQTEVGKFRETLSKTNLKINIKNDKNK